MVTSARLDLEYFRDEKNLTEKDSSTYMRAVAPHSANAVQYPPASQVEGFFCSRSPVPKEECTMYQAHTDSLEMMAQMGIIPEPAVG